jgi:AcrR family transcriptional regulator
MLTIKHKVHEEPPFNPVYSAAGDPPSKRKILQAALHLFVQKSVDGVTVREIAAEAGYTNPVLFKYFPAKEAVAVYLFETCYEQLFDRLSAAVTSGLPFNQRMEAILEVFFSQMEQDMEAFLFVQDHLREMWLRVSKRIRGKSILALIRSVLEQGVSESAVSAKLNLDLLVTAIAGTLQQFARMIYFGQFKGPVRTWSPEVQAIILRIVAPNKQ